MSSSVVKETEERKNTHGEVDPLLPEERKDDTESQSCFQKCEDGPATNFESFKEDDSAQWEDLYDQVSHDSPQSSTETRRSFKLTFDPNLSHQKRRERTLQWQKSRRDQILEKIRHLEGDSSYSDSESEEPLDFLDFVNQSSNSNIQQDAAEEMEVGFVSKQKYQGKQRQRQRPSAPLTVMLSEWLIDKPDDFDEKWVGVLCPVGKRCMVVASRGRTKIFTRRDFYLGCYPSMLPGGRKDGYCVSGNRSRGVSILDCIWSESSQVFYVLDLICWNSHPCINCDTDYRQFFLASKFQENEILLQRNRLNPFPFIPLPYFTAENLTTIMTSSYPPFPENIDGIIFLHKESFYISEVNPLCLWLRLCDVDRRLGISVSPELVAKQEPLREKPPRVDKKRKQRPSKQMEVIES